MWDGSSSEASTVVFGLPVMNGSTSTVVSPDLSSTAAWARKRMSTAIGSVSFGRIHEQFCQFVPDRHADQHAHAGLLGDQRAHRAQALVGIREAGGLEDLGLMCRSEPVGRVERLV